MISIQSRPVMVEQGLDRYTHLVADLDSTLVKGRIAQGQGKYFLWDEAKRLHLPHVLLGATNYRKVKEMARRGEAEGLEYFGNVIGRTGCATKDDFLDYAYRFIEEHSLPGAVEFMDYFSERMHTFIATLGSQIAADAAADFYKCKEGVGNRVIYREGSGSIIKGINIGIRDGKDKLQATVEMLKRHKLRIIQGIAIGNDRYDHETLRASALPLAGPQADEETKQLVRELRGTVIEDFDSFLDGLEAEI